MGRWIAASFAAAALAGAASIAAAAPVNIYGIDNNNTIWEIDPIARTFVDVNQTALPGSQVSNSMAYDTDRDEFMFTYNATFGGVGPSIRFWDRATTGQQSVPAVATFGQAGITGDPANAAYYDNAFWYMAPNAPVLHRVSFTYVNDHPTSPVDTAYRLDAAAGYVNPLYPASSYGDIAIDVPNGVLYGDTVGGLFYSIDLKQLGVPGAQIYRQIATGLGSLQLSFNGDYSTLFAQTYDTGDWFTLDGNSGAKVALGFSTLVPGTGKGFRDLGGAATTDAGTTCDMTPPGNSDNQSAQVGTAVKHPPTVQLLGLTGNPQVGVPVTFTVLSGGGTLGGAASAAVFTDARGIATAPSWVMGADPGANTVLADSVGNVCNLRFRATATAGPPPPSPDEPGTKPQTPTHSVGLPDSIHVGVNDIADLPVRTTAGLVAKVRITCTIASTGRRAPKGRCVTYTDQRTLKLRVSCGPAVRVRVVVSAPADGDYKALRRTRTYVAAGNCAVTG